MSEVEAIAKAVEKTAELGTQSLKTAEKAGGFVARVFKQPLEQCAGILTDQLRLIRLRRLAEIADEVDRILESRGVRETRAVPPKLAVPLLDHASLENDPALEGLWNELLANAMDPSFTAELRVAYTEIIRNLTAIDAAILRAMLEKLKTTDCLDRDNVHRFGVSRETIIRRTGMAETDYSVSIQNLMRLQCIAPKVIRVRPGVSISLSQAEYLYTDRGSDVVVLTALGLDFLAACVKDALAADPDPKLRWTSAGDGKLEMNIRALNL